MLSFPLFEEDWIGSIFGYMDCTFQFYIWNEPSSWLNIDIQFLFILSKLHLLNFDVRPLPVRIDPGVCLYPNQQGILDTLLFFVISSYPLGYILLSFFCTHNSLELSPISDEFLVSSSSPK